MIRRFLDEGTRLNNPVNLIVMSNKKPPVDNKISITEWLKGNLDMSHIGNFHFRKEKINPVNKNFVQYVAKS